jgi:hypothetical protein
VPIELIGDIWTSVSGELLITSRSVGSLDELASLECRVGANDGHQMRTA